MRSNKSKIAKEILYALFVGLWANASASKIINHDKLISLLYTTVLFGGYTIYLPYFDTCNICSHLYATKNLLPYCNIITNVSAGTIVTGVSRKPV